MLTGIVFFAVLASAGIAFSLPRTAGAFWPFTVTNAEGGSAPLLHDASLDLLSAPNSTDLSGEAAGNMLTTSDKSALVPDTSAVSSPVANPSPDTTDTVTSPSSGSISTYTVKAGDSLSGIAQDNGVSVNTILWANNITDPSTIKAGTKLVILPVSGIEHIVKSGETLSSLAKKYGADASDIAQFNGLSATGSLTQGSMIIIPGGELPSPSRDKANASPVVKSPTKTSTPATSAPASTKSTSSSDTGVVHYSNATNNPYKGGSGAALSGFFSNPLPGAILTQSIHGWNGVDLSAHTGTPIQAAASGTVILARSSGWNGGYGEYVIVDHGNGIETLYSHMSSVKVSAGDSVSAGDVLGAVGVTGEATGPHLHFEVRGAKNPFATCEEMTVCSPH